MRTKLSALLILSILLSSCGTLFLGVKKSVYLVDAPKDVEVLKNGSPLVVKEIILGSRKGGGTNSVYYYPGIKTKIRRNDKYVIKVGAKTTDVTIKAKRQYVLLLLEGLISFGAYTAIDLLTGGDKKPVPKFIDVPALLNHQKPRDQKELRRVAYSQLN